MNSSPASRSSCLPNEEFSWGQCQRKCKDGYHGVGSTCAKQCPATGQFESLGPLCQKIGIDREAGTVPQMEPCLPPLQDNGRDCIDPVSCSWPDQCTGTGLASVPQERRLKCKGAHQELVNGLCQNKCPKGYKGHGNKCQPDCPAGFRESENTSGNAASRHCVKPTYGRGLGKFPQNSPLTTISQSPNGSTLLERYRIGTTPQGVAKASASNFLGTNLGDPSNTGTSILGDMGGGFISEIFQIFYQIATSLGNSLGGGGATGAIIGFLILLGLIQFSPTIISFFFTRAIDAGISGFSSITSTAVGAVGKISEAAGQAVQRAERGVGSVVVGAEEFVGNVGRQGLESVGQIGKGALRGATEIATGAIESAESLGNVAGRTFVSAFKPGPQLVSREAAAKNISEIISQSGGVPAPSVAPAAAAAAGGSIDTASWLQNLSPEMKAQLMQLLSH